MTNNFPYDKEIVDGPAPILLDRFEGRLELNVGYEDFF